MIAKRIKLEHCDSDEPETSTHAASQEDADSVSGEQSSISGPSKLSTAELSTGDDAIPPDDDVPLTKEQEEVLNKVKDGRSIFFTGAAGTGKSLLLRRIVHYLRVERGLGDMEVVVTAPTGLAARTIDGGTLHSWAGIGIQTSASAEELLPRILGFRRYYDMLHEAKDDPVLEEDVDDLPTSMQRWVLCKVLIIDEISMLDGPFFDKLEDMARFIRRNQAPFGGIQLILSGDFLQLPPVAKRGVDLAFQSKSWDRCVSDLIVLKDTHRQRNQEFIRVLHDVRRGLVTRRVQDFVRRHSQPVVWPKGTWPVDLCAKRDIAAQKNDRALAELDGPSRIFESVDTPSYLADSNEFPVASELELKIGARVMLVKNLVPNVLVNGSLGEVIGFQTPAHAHETKSALIGVPFALAELSRAPAYAYQHNEDELAAWLEDEHEWPVVRFTYGNGKPQTVDVLCVPLEFRAPRLDEVCRRRQVPLTLAYALTVHKAQGLTLERVRVDFDGMWEFGQSYVALSRAVDPEQLEILNFESWRVKANPVAVAWCDGLAAAPAKPAKRPFSQLN